MADLIERLRKCADSESRHDGFTDDLLREAAAALEAAREDACVALVADIRFACGDNGKRMQPELVEFVRELAADAERYRWLRENCGLSGSGPHTGAQVIVYYADCGDGRHGIAYTGPKQRVGIMALDAAIDQARGKGGGE